MNISDQYPVLFFKTESDWETWLAANHQSCPGVWLKFYKKIAQKLTLTYRPALDVALCYGWIDSQSKRLDEASYIQKFTPRKSKSLWSKINREHIARLQAAGRMKPAGLEQVKKAQADGRWEEAYDSPSQAQAPEELVVELAKHPRAKAFFDSLNKTNTYAIIWRIQTAKKPETRQKRIQQIIEMLEQGKTFH